MTQDEIATEIGRALGNRRKTLGLSLAQVSQRCGVSLQQIHKYETGQTPISAPMLYRLALCLDVHPGYFFATLDGLSRVATPDAAASGRT